MRGGILPSVTSNVSRKSSSNLMRARASWERKQTQTQMRFKWLQKYSNRFQTFHVLTSTWNPRTNALTKSAALVSEAMSWVSLHVWGKKGFYKTITWDTRKLNLHKLKVQELTLISTFRVLRLNLTWSCRFSTIGVKIFNQFSFSGVYLWAGTAILRISSGPWNTRFRHMLSDTITLALKLDLK